MSLKNYEMKQQHTLKKEHEGIHKIKKHNVKSRALLWQKKGGKHNGFTLWNDIVWLKLQKILASNQD